MDKNPSTATVKSPSSNFTGDASSDGEAATWLEPVTDEQYLAAHRTTGV
jgi:hypothetical protein